MRFIKYLAIAMLLATGCVKSYTIGTLYIRNESGQVLYVESTIQSDLTEAPMQFTLLEGTDEIPNNNDVAIARTKRLMGEQTTYLPISHYVFNEDAQVNIFTVSDDGEKTLVRTWNYSDRNKNGREFFKESCLGSGDFDGAGVDGGCFISFRFIVLPEDLESN
jgi:hypothetical protein